MEDHDLRDGTRLSVPSGAYYALDEGYHLENHGIQPDVEVSFAWMDPSSCCCGMLCDRHGWEMVEQKAKSRESQRALSLVPSSITCD